MQPTTDQRPETAAPDRAPDTGTVEQAITHATATEPAGYYAARLRYLRAHLQRAHAEEREHEALAAMYRAARHASAGDRHMLASLADRDAGNAKQLAERLERDIEALTTEHPEALLGTDPHAVVIITIERDRIVTGAALHMGRVVHATQTERRSDRLFWRCHDREWSEYRARLGDEFVEFLESIDLPRRVADMLPRPATPAGAAIVADAAAALRT